MTQMIHGALGTPIKTLSDGEKSFSTLAYDAPVHDLTRKLHALLASHPDDLQAAFDRIRNAPPLQSEESIDPSEELEDLVEEMDIIDFETAEGQDEGIRTPESAGADAAEDIDPIEKMGEAFSARPPRRQGS